MADASDDDSDDWATEELPVLPPPCKYKDLVESHQSRTGEIDDDGDWATKLVPPMTTGKESSPVPSGEPMLLVDMTLLSNEMIHSKFDPNAVNDPVAVKQLRTLVEQKYDDYHSNTELVSNGTVIPCGSSVWRPALHRLRKERPGHFFSPVFPPKQK